MFLVSIIFRRNIFAVSLSFANKSSIIFPSLIEEDNKKFTIGHTVMKNCHNFHWRLAQYERGFLYEKIVELCYVSTASREWPTGGRPTND